MDNVSNISEVHSSQRQSRAGGNLTIRKLDPKTMAGDDMNSLWSKLATQDYAFDDNSRGDPRAFVLSLTDPASHHFLVNDSAYIVVRNVFPGSDCNIHFVAWDRHFPFSLVIDAGKQTLEWLFKEQAVNRVTGYIPKYNALACRFAVTMGFKYEGTLRKAVKFHQDFHDVDIYGILHKEFDRRFQQ